MSYGIPPNGSYPPQDPSTVSEETKSADPSVAKSLLFVGALSPETCTREHIIELFSVYGQLVGVNYNRSAGCAFVLFQRSDDSLRAMANLQRFGFHGRQLEVRFANPDAAPQVVPSPPVTPQFTRGPTGAPMGPTRTWTLPFHDNQTPMPPYPRPYPSHYNGPHAPDYNGPQAPDYDDPQRPPIGGPRARALNPNFRPWGGGGGSGFFGGGSAYGRPRPPPRPLFGVGPNRPSPPMGNRPPPPFSNRPMRPPPRWQTDSPNQFRPRGVENRPWRPENRQPPQAWTPGSNEQNNWAEGSNEQKNSPAAAASQRTPTPPQDPNAVPSPSQPPAALASATAETTGAPSQSEPPPQACSTLPAADESEDSPTAPSPSTSASNSMMPSTFASVAQLPEGQPRRRKRGGQKERERRERIAMGLPGARPPQPLHSARPFGAFAPQPLASVKATAPPKPAAPLDGTVPPSKRAKLQPPAELLPHPQSEERLAEGAPVLDGAEGTDSTPPQATEQPSAAEPIAEEALTPKPLTAKQLRIQEENEKKIQTAIRKIWRDVTDEDGAILDQNEIPDMFVCGGCHLITSNAEFFFKHRQLPCDRKPINKRATEEPIILNCNQCGINCRNSWDLLVHLAHVHGVCMYEEDEPQTIEYPDIQLANNWQQSDYHQA